MYDERQKEIDAANRWWAERWQEYCWLHEASRTTEELLKNKNRYSTVQDELDAAAAKVMEGEDGK